MTWRSNISGNDRFFGCLPYLLPLIEIAGTLTLLSKLVPFLAPLKFFLLLLAPFLQLYSIFIRLVPFGLGAFAVFLLMYLAVVQNPKIGYSVRFNTLQAILLSVVLSLWNIVGQYIFIGDLGLILLLAMPVVILGACLYSIGMTASGRYPEIPKFSENVYAMLPN